MTTLNMVRLAAFSLLCSQATSLTTLPAAADTNVMLIFDSSGSMKTSIGRESRMEAAKRAMVDTLGALPTDARLGLLLYGHRRPRDCSDIELVSPIGSDDAAQIAARIKTLQPKGETPIAASLKQATRSFSAFKGQNNRVVLVTDGIEECGGDPCAAAKEVAAAGLDLKVDVVGFTLNAAQRKTVQCVADLTGGTYYDAQNAQGLKTALAEVRETVAAAPPPPKRINLLSPKSGGALLAAPHDLWAQTNDDRTDYVWITYPQVDEEGVYGFKDDRSATFDTFAVAINATEGRTPKEVEVLAGDEGPTGQFRSVATCTTQNIKLMKALFQECKFAPVTAKLVKLKLVSTHNGGKDVIISEFALYGELAGGQAAAPASAASPVTRVELIGPKSGGELLAAPNDIWPKASDGNSGYVWITYIKPGEEGVYGFKDDRAATFDRVAVAVTATEGRNPKEIEILAGNDSPTGTFRSVATCTTQNIKLMKALFQECAFPPVTAKYVKFKPLSTHNGGNDVIVSEFEVLGQLSGPAPTAAAAPDPGAINLLSPKQGGALLAAPNDLWANNNDDKLGYVWITYLQTDQEGVYGFKDDRAATFDTFGTLILATEGRNPKEVELLAGSDGPTGQFRSVATCTTKNIKLLRTPFQPCTFAPVTAKFVKVKVLSTHNGGKDVIASEFSLMGKLSP